MTAIYSMRYLREEKYKHAEFIKQSIKQQAIEHEANKQEVMKPKLRKIDKYQYEKGYNSEEDFDRDDGDYYTDEHEVDNDDDANNPCKKKQLLNDIIKTINNINHVQLYKYRIQKLNNRFEGMNKIFI